MKKFLALVLALVMTMSLVTISAGAKFTDADDVTYAEAVEVMTAAGVVGGYADGSFNPTAGLTRGAAAKIICNMILGPTTAEALVANSAPYSDVPANSTFAGYIAYCANEGIISGYADGTFKPAAPLSGYAFMKMLLGALGYDADVEGYVGANWSIAVAKRALNIELDKGLVGDFSGAKALTREEACLYAFNTLKAEMVEYDVNSSITIGDIVISNSSKAEGTGNTFMSQYFKKLEKGTAAADKKDVLGRPATTWYYDDEKVGTYAEAADMTIVDFVKQKDLDEKFEDLTWLVSEIKEGDTANGKTIELYINEDDEVTKAIEIEAELVAVQFIQKDKVSTAKKDERAVQFDNGLWICADKKVSSGVEVSNFEAVYAAAKEADDDNKTLDVLVITNEAGDKIFSVEIPEIVEAKVSRVKDGAATAGGESYKRAGTKGAYVAVSVGDDKLTVGENGCIYKAEKKAGEKSDIIFLDSYLKTTTDKYGEATYTALIVDENNEIVEWVVDVDTYAQGFYTYEINDDDEYELTWVDAVAGSAMDEDKAYVTIAGKKTYFADDMIVVFIGETGKKLEVVVKDGVQDGITADFYVVDDKEITVAYVLEAYEEADSDEVIFLKDVTADAKVEDLKGDKADAYDAYLDGDKIEITIKNEDAVKEAGAGFYTFKIDAKTGKYELTKKTSYAVTVVDGVITQNKFITANGNDDMTVDGAIYDLSDEGLASLKAISKWDGAKKAIMNYMYDTKDEVITVIYVTLEA